MCDSARAEHTTSIDSLSMVWLQIAPRCPCSHGTVVQAALLRQIEHRTHDGTVIASVVPVAWCRRKRNLQGSVPLRYLTVLTTRERR